MPAVQKYNLKLLGESIRLVSDEEEEYVGAIMAYIENTIKEFSRSGQAAGLTPAVKFLYSCVFITDELLKERTNSEKIKANLTELTALVNKPSKPDKAVDEEKYKAEIAALKKQLSQAEKERNEAKRELDEFIKEFDDDK